MPLSEYGESVGGGLKLKGVKDGRVKKAKKAKNKERKEQPVDEQAEDSAEGRDVRHKSNDGELSTIEETQGTESGAVMKRPEGNKYGKTEAQLRHEERRRQLTEERAKREGVKTHKEKVEELNKYLSRLSEHHDMPKIGPG